MSVVLMGASGASAAVEDSGGAALAMFVLVVAVAGWLGLRTLVRSMRARKAETQVGASFADFAREALVNAARIDGRVNDPEREAVARALAEIAPEAGDESKLAAAFTSARLGKDELVAYLTNRQSAFTREQKMALLKALLAVFVADGQFDEAEHAALVDYTAAVGFDRQSAPGLLRSLSRDFVRGSIT